MSVHCKSLREELTVGNNFIISAELSAGPNFTLGSVEKFLRAYSQEPEFGHSDGFHFVAVTATENPGGVANVEPADMYKLICDNNLLAGLTFIPHISCKDKNTAALTSTLEAFRRSNIDTIVALTGDKPMSAKGVFEVESIGLLEMIKKMNNLSYASKGIDKGPVHQFYCGAAVSPFKYTEASQMQQYYKMEKKIRCGAEFLITQVGWDWKKSAELFRYMKENNLSTPVLGNVYLLSTTNQGPRLMNEIKLAGCFVSDELLEQLSRENFDQHVERAAQQIAMYRDLGARGVHIGGVHDFELFKKIINRAAEISRDWQQYKDNLCWPAKDVFYLYENNGRSNEKIKKKFKHRMFNAMHRTVMDPDHAGFHLFRKTMKLLGTEKSSGATYKMFNASEKTSKYLMFDCQECGDCYLPENFGLCTIGGCEKGLNNVPCGDSTVDGYCGNNLDRICIGERIYNSAAAEKGGLEKLRKTINKPRIVKLKNTSSILNYLFERDHTMKNPIIYIGESIHASIPRVSKVMKQLLEMGPEAYTAHSEAQEFMKALIESQVNDGADYVAVNVDAFIEISHEVAMEAMLEYVKMIRKWGNGVPICLDSSDDKILKAGLAEWYNTAEKVAKPLVNSIKVYSADEMMPLKNKYDFAFIGLLVSMDKPKGLGGSHSVDELFALAKELFDKAVDTYGFKPEEIFFDSTVFPLSIDMPMSPGIPGYTYRAFETIKKIKADPRMKNTHFSMGISNCMRDLPARGIGICRAYVAKAMEYGLDAGIVNTAHQYGKTPPDKELLELVDAYAKMDGSAEKMTHAMTLMGQFCKLNRKKK
ncbi:MAG: methylenetetrahydrofolate reductase C-terminal domain-containing protein [Phycisphaerae bacterium]|nr:methylenetetrahydrofolate reductase C-terminal domain-containing protein [Phycisphaerae bacterium]